jgi:hypothetical protein
LCWNIGKRPGVHPDQSRYARTPSILYQHHLEIEFPLNYIHSIIILYILPTSLSRLRSSSIQDPAGSELPLISKFQYPFIPTTCKDLCGVMSRVSFDRHERGGGGCKLTCTGSVNSSPPSLSPSLPTHTSLLAYQPF